MPKVGLVLEGGAMRGMYSAGVLDTFMDNNIAIDGIIGVSAGALFGVNYYSGQKGRVIRYNKRFCGDKRYISIRSLLLTGNIVNKKFAFYRVTNELEPFDNVTYLKTKKDYYAVVTNVKNGKAEYIKLDDVIEKLEVLRATSAMPMVSKMVKIGKDKYLDGAIGDSIPVEKFKQLGYEKIIVILTRPLDYRKTPFNKTITNLINLKYWRYPKFKKALLGRAKKYNETVQKIVDMETKKEIFVIRPSQSINVRLIEKDPEKLQEVYDLGVKDCLQAMKALRKYLRD